MGHPRHPFRPPEPPVRSDAAAAAEAARLRALMQRPTAHGDPAFDALLRELWVVVHCLRAGLTPPAAPIAPGGGGPDRPKSSSVDATVEAEVRALLSGVHLDGTSSTNGDEVLVGPTGAPLAAEAELKGFLGPCGLGPFLGALLDFGVECVEDLCDPTLVTDALLQVPPSPPLHPDARSAWPRWRTV
jgi:hypothetical protein